MVFGFSKDIYCFGSIIFVNIVYFILDEDMVEIVSLVIGLGCLYFYFVKFIINIFGMSFGVLLKLVV